MLGNDYYTKHSSSCIRVHRTMAALFRAGVVERFGEQAWSEIAAGSNRRFQELLEQLPYVGGKANPLTLTLIQAGSLLALWHVLKPRGISEPEFGRLIDRVVPAYLERYPRFLLRWLGALYLSPIGKARVAKLAKRSQQRAYAGDFVYSVVHGDGQGFVWGVDYQECGIVKFLQAQGAEALGPYLCTLDYAAFGAMGIELQRKGTIAQGSPCCDFRFLRRN